MLALLTGLTPLILALGFKIIDWTVSDANDKTIAKKNFADAIAKHASDALISSSEHTNDQDQVDDLKQQAADAAKGTTNGPK